ncbi:MAG TPA: hypothetical protein VIT65_00460, partial [Microlunatus sp.]
MTSATSPNYHQPGPDEDDWRDRPRTDDEQGKDRPADAPSESEPDPEDLAWFESNRNAGDTPATDVSTDTASPEQQR